MSADHAKKPLNSWTTLRDEIRRRIDRRVWRPGELIPNEAELAEEFACARATVNRALRELAQEGLVTRKRRAGTRVTPNPATRALLTIPIIREEIEALGFAYRHSILENERRQPPGVIRHRLDLAENEEALSVATMHLADNHPYALDTRWINLSTTPLAADIDFSLISPNEWLVQQAPYTHGDLAIFSEAASAFEAEQLGVDRGAALLVLERSTWRERRSVTTARIAFPPGRRIVTQI